MINISFWNEVALKWSKVISIETLTAIKQGVSSIVDNNSKEEQKEKSIVEEIMWGLDEDDEDY